MERLIARDWGRFTFHVYCLHCNLLTNHHQKGKNQHCSAQRKNKKRWNVNKGHNLSGKCTCTTVGITVQSSYIFWATNCHHNNYLQLIWAGCYWPVWMVFTLMRKRFTWEVWKDSWHMTTLTMTTFCTQRLMNELMPTYCGVWNNSKETQCHTFWSKWHQPLIM